MAQAVQPEHIPSEPDDLLDPSEPGDLLDDVRDAVRVSQHAAAEALRSFRQTLDEAVPDAVHPLRTTIADAAMELADKLMAVQYQLNRNLVRSADRALNKADDAAT